MESTIKRIPFDVEGCPKDIKLVFYEKTGWFEGILKNDSEYGWCIELWETYGSIKGITHYFDPTTLP